MSSGVKNQPCLKLIESINLLMECIGDMHELISAAQMNLTGESINGLYDEPIKSSIGNTVISQKGIDKTKQVIEKVRFFLSSIDYDHIADTSKMIK